MRGYNCFEGAKPFCNYLLDSKTVRLTREQIEFIEKYLPNNDFSYNLRSIIHEVMRKTKDPL